MIEEERGLLFRGAVLLTMDAAGRTLTGDLRVAGGRIREIGADLEPNGEAIVDASGRWILPGFIQGHVHLGQTLFRGLAEDRRLLDWLGDAIWPLEAAHTEESAYWTALIGGLEAIRGGTTTILDIGLVHGMEGVFRALRDLGLRAWTGKLLMDRGEGAPPRLLEDPRTAIAESRELARRWHGAENDRIRYAVCPRFVYSCSGDLWERAVDQARGEGHILHTHALETREEQDAVRALENRSELDTLEAVGALSVPLKIAHGVWVDDPSADRLAAAGSAVMHCPASNLKLGSGIADLLRLENRGIPLGLGSDGSPCNNFLDPMTEMRLAALLQKWRHGPGAFSALQALSLLTRGGAQAIGAPNEIGSLEVGKKADLVVLNPDDLHSIAADSVDLPTRVVFGSDRTNVESVYVDGRLVCDRGAFPGFNLDEIKSRAREELKLLLKRKEAE